MSSCAYWTHLALLLLNCTYMQSNRPQRLSMTDTVTTWHDWQGAHTMAKPPNWSKTGLLLLLPLSVYLSVYLFRYQSPGMPNLHDMACFLACGGATGRQL